MDRNSSRMSGVMTMSELSELIYMRRVSASTLALACIAPYAPNLKLSSSAPCDIC